MDRRALRTSACARLFCLPAAAAWCPSRKNADHGREVESAGVGDRMPLVGMAFCPRNPRAHAVDERRRDQERTYNVLTRPGTTRTRVSEADSFNPCTVACTSLASAHGQTSWRVAIDVQRREASGQQSQYVWQEPVLGARQSWNEECWRQRTFRRQQPLFVRLVTFRRIARRLQPRRREQEAHLSGSIRKRHSE